MPYSNARLLILVRHAQAVGHGEHADFMRPLTAHGREQAERAGKELSESGLPLSGVHLWASPASRTMETTKILARFLPTEHTVIPVDALYDAEITALGEMIRETPNAVKTLIIVGHNPTIAEMASTLCTDNIDSPADMVLMQGFPTGTIAAFRVKADWAGFSPSNAHPVFHFVP